MTEPERVAWAGQQPCDPCLGSTPESAVLISARARCMSTTATLSLHPSMRIPDMYMCVRACGKKPGILARKHAELHVRGSCNGREQKQGGQPTWRCKVKGGGACMHVGLQPNTHCAARRQAGAGGLAAAPSLDRPPLQLPTTTQTSAAAAARARHTSSSSSRHNKCQCCTVHSTNSNGTKPPLRNNLVARMYVYVQSIAAALPFSTHPTTRPSRQRRG